MNRLRVVHMLDDFAAGGVRNALSIYRSPELTRIACSKTIPVKPNTTLAPHVDADVIITHFPPRWRALPFLWSLRFRNPNATLIHVEHSYTRHWEAQNVPDRTRFRGMLQLAFAVYNRIVAVSEGQAEWLRVAAGVADKKLRVIPPWSRPLGLEALKNPDWKGDRPLRIGAYGRFTESKGFDRLIRAFGQLDPERYELKLGGFGSDEARLRRLAKGCKNISFTGRVRDLASFLSECDIIAVPSRWEAYGLVAMEARLAGRPILVSGVDGLYEQVGEAGDVVDFDNPAAFAELLTQLSERRMERMAKAARASVANAYQTRISAWTGLLRLRAA